ncbi:MAG: F0F1 ATP synthase subunit delta [Patescibacteria group bacterium]|jgi:F0F1-type ATP synthase delta subunit
MKKSLKPLARSIVEQLAELKPAEVEKEMVKIVRFLQEESLLGRWRELEKEIHQAWRNKFGASKVTVLSAHELSKTARQQLEDSVKGAELIERVDERLMGGAVIRIDDRRLDGSIIGALQRLKNTLLA